MNRILVLGARGTLGGQLTNLYPNAVAWDREDVDVTDFPALERRIADLPAMPEAIVNCVAFNDVDGAEDRPEKAFSLNAIFPGALAQFAAARDIPLVHYSTNYVFDGLRGEYREDDPPSPVSVYAHSKAAGEDAVRAAGGRSYILRTAVLFGPKGASELSKKSFVDLMIDLASKRDTLQVVSDEINSLTYAPDLAAITRDLLERLPEPGIYHATNSGSASWFDFAKEIFRITGKTVNVLPVPSTQYPRKARRPPRSILLNTRLAQARDWKAALAEFLQGR